MLVDIKPQLNDSSIQELIGYSTLQDPEQLSQVISTYESDTVYELYGMVSEEEIVGIVGCTQQEEGTVVIRHLAVKPECRGAGFGRGLILELIQKLEPTTLIAETDEEAVEFYRSIGFIIESLGEKYPGVERFRCSYEV